LAAGLLAALVAVLRVAALGAALVLLVAVLALAALGTALALLVVGRLGGLVTLAGVGLLGVGLRLLGVVLSLGLAAGALLSLTLGLAALLAAVLAIVLGHRPGQVARGVGDVLLLLAELVLVHGAALRPGADGLLAADDLVELLEQLLDALALAAQFLVAVVREEDVEDGPQVGGQLLVLLHHRGQVADRDRLGALERGDELVELGVDAFRAGLLERLLDRDGLLAVLRLAAGGHALGQAQQLLLEVAELAAEPFLPDGRVLDDGLLVELAVVLLVRRGGGLGGLDDGVIAQRAARDQEDRRRQRDHRGQEPTPLHEHNPPSTGGVPHSG